MPTAEYGGPLAASQSYDQMINSEAIDISKGNYVAALAPEDVYGKKHIASNYVESVPS
jgi:hypothetical protein